VIAQILPQLTNLRDNPIPLHLLDLPDPTPGPGEVLLRVAACGVCHTELDEIEGRTPPPVLPMILGHQVVGRVAALGPGASRLALGERVGVAWIFSACGECPACLAGDENLCPHFRATGRDAPGGYAELMVVPEAFAHPIPDIFSDVEAAPLLCAGAVGYRSLRLANLTDGQPLGLTGFGGSGHQVLLLARHLYPRSPVYVFARSPETRAFALNLGAAWAGDSAETPPQPPAAIIDTTPAWKPVVEALAALAPGGRLVINAIRKEEGDKAELLRLDYARHLWQEKEIKSVANVARRDVAEFLALAAQIPIRPEIEIYPFEAANQALFELKTKQVRGAKVLKVRR
jgi:propanol-preferring alcohol dehydrogenase